MCFLFVEQCDLSQILYDEEMRKIISIYEVLDARKDSYVRLSDYIAAKRKLYEENLEEMTPELKEKEINRFRLIDLNNHGIITWNEFIEFEAADLLAKKNKVN